MLHEYSSFCDARLLNTTVIIFVSFIRMFYWFMGVFDLCMKR